ncbi:HIT family protein [Pseudoduganella buxea]|uniref:HIT domain-containing protein n=1 Tax=Pseudoduganella buxea TaxID=1949069 RepID=A0A6I3SSR2_9BURK|nr:HIT family protein [Pseudoduganella buxea]MTV51685.1 HIT domain-containing protein [Pseudoduganella buxea]GGC05161.1 HIT family protein [Pseudoduganella buxea]
MASACDLCTLLAAPPAGAVIWQDEALAVVAVDEPGYPGFTRVVWRAHVREMTDLAPAERERVMRAVWAVEEAQREVMAPHKVNLASFGNMTPHVHWHVIPRYTDDAHFPNPTWGAVQRTATPASLEGRAALLPQLHAAILQRLTNHHA